MLTIPQDRSLSLASYQHFLLYEGQYEGTPFSMHSIRHDKVFIPPLKTRKVPGVDHVDGCNY